MSRLRIDRLADLRGIATETNRNRNEPQVSAIRRSKSFSRVNGVTSAVKTRRLTTLARYVDLVARTGEANAAGDLRRQRSELRKRMVAHIVKLRPTIRSSRVRKAPRERDLVKVVDFVLSGIPSVIWRREDVRIRKWTIVTLLVLCGVRHGELRQIREDDVDTNVGEIIVVRRPDDQEDPRVPEPNAKTYDRIIPIPNFVSERLDEHILSPRSDAAVAGVDTPFLFLAQDNRTFGLPISKNVVWMSFINSETSWAFLISIRTRFAVHGFRT